MKKRQIIQEYNRINTGYHITGIKKLSKEHLDYANTHGAKTLDELYVNCSDAKRRSLQAILNTYNPTIISLQGNCMAYSVYLIAGNGSVLWITRDNNYLVEVV